MVKKGAEKLPYFIGYLQGSPEYSSIYEISLQNTELYPKGIILSSLCHINIVLYHFLLYTKSMIKRGNKQEHY